MLARVKNARSSRLNFMQNYTARIAAIIARELLNKSNKKWATLNADAIEELQHEFHSQPEQHQHDQRSRSDAQIRQDW